jgi:hypothetical protein
MLLREMPFTVPPSLCDTEHGRPLWPPTAPHGTPQSCMLSGDNVIVGLTAGLSPALGKPLIETRTRSRPERTSAIPSIASTTSSFVAVSPQSRASPTHRPSRLFPQVRCSKSQAGRWFTGRISDRVRRAFDLAFENGVLWSPQIFQILDKGHADEESGRQQPGWAGATVAFTLGASAGTRPRSPPPYVRMPVNPRRPRASAVSSRGPEPHPISHQPASATWSRMPARPVDRTRQRPAAD